MRGPGNDWVGCGEFWALFCILLPNLSCPIWDPTTWKNGKGDRINMWYELLQDTQIARNVTFFFYIKIKLVHTSTFLGIGNSRINHWGLHPLFCKEPWMRWAPGLCSHLPVTTVHLKEGGSLSIFFPLCQAWSWGLSLRVLESQGRHPDSATLGSLCTWAQASATPGMLFAQTFQGTISPRLRTALSS